MRFYFSLYFLVLVSIEKIYQTLKREFDHISKHLDVRQKYSATRRIFNSLLGVWKGGQTRSFVFDILNLSPKQRGHEVYLDISSFLVHLS